MVDRWEEKWNLLFPVNNRCNFLELAQRTVKLLVTLKVHVHAGGIELRNRLKLWPLYSRDNDICFAFCTRRLLPRSLCTVV